MLTNLMLLNNESATGTPIDWKGGPGTFHVVGNFGGATVSLERLGPDGSTWTEVGPDTTLTAEGMGNFSLGRGKLRASVTGGAPSGLYANVTGF